MIREGWGGNIAAIAAAALLVAGCASNPVSLPEPVLVPVEVFIPVAAPCVPANLAAPPEYPDTDDALRMAPDPAARYQLLYAGRKVRDARLSEIEPIVTLCPKAHHP